MEPWMYVVTYVLVGIIVACIWEWRGCDWDYTPFPAMSCVFWPVLIVLTPMLLVRWYRRNRMNLKAELDAERRRIMEEKEERIQWMEACNNFRGKLNRIREDYDLPEEYF